MDKVRNEHIRESLRATPIMENWKEIVWAGTAMWWRESKIMWLEEWWTWMWKDGMEEVDLKKDGLTV
jgi:hypothetical protein